LKIITIYYIIFVQQKWFESINAKMEKLFSFIQTFFFLIKFQCIWLQTKQKICFIDKEKNHQWKLSWGLKVTNHSKKKKKSSVNENDEASWKKNSNN
jgi:predicted ABC-type exoprotein transport system permease subunit